MAEERSNQGGNPNCRSFTKETRDDRQTEPAAEHPRLSIAAPPPWMPEVYGGLGSTWSLL
jgi:hypothetical protein